MSLLSIIVPVYNTGIYLNKCVESILAQTYSNLELIIVDDGSELETASICDKIAAQDNRVVVRHTPNHGVSAARNLALDIARGTYVGFIDSDDWIEPNMFESLISAMQSTNSQIAMCDAVTKREGHPDEPDTIPDLDKSCTFASSDINPAMLTRLAGSAWRCVYRRNDMLEKWHIRFPQGLKFSEDRIFNIRAMRAAQNIIYIKRPFYNRLIRKGSASFRFYPDMTNQIAHIRDVMISTVRETWGEPYVQQYELQIAGQIKYAVTNYTASYSNYTITRSVRALKELCNNPSIQQCINASGSIDLRSKLISAKMYRTLFVIGKITNTIHRLCHKGQYQQ